MLTLLLSLAVLLPLAAFAVGSLVLAREDPRAPEIIELPTVPSPTTTATPSRGVVSPHPVQAERDDERDDRTRQTPRPSPRDDVDDRSDDRDDWDFDDDGRDDDQDDDGDDD